jgi:pimeloyl-ACP methyl ester carboxylesterase
MAKSRVPAPLYCPVPGGTLAYSLFGGGERKAIFFHGHPGSRHQGAFVGPHAKPLGLEIAAFDRAGFGHSSLFPSGKNPLDLAPALRALADQLGWKRFHLIAVSGGAPYALNSAPGLAERVHSIHLICGMGPLADPRFRRRFPRGALEAMRLANALPAPVLSGALRLALLAARRTGRRNMPFLSPGDAELLGSPMVSSTLRDSLDSAFRQGVAGARRDWRAFLSPWELDMAAISAPVTFWHGREDRLVPCEFSEWLSSRIPRSVLRLVEGEGHYTLPLLRAREILEEIP